MCFGGGSQPEQTQQTSTMQIPDWLSNYYQGWQIPQAEQLYGTGQNIYNQMANYTPYPGQQIQPFTNAQLTAMNMAEQNAGLGIDASGNMTWINNPLGMDQLSNANALTQQGAQSYADAGGGVFTPTSVQTQDFPSSVNQYMDPYMNTAITGSLNNMEMLRQQNLMGNDANAVNAGAFGGDRQAVADALTNKNWDTTEANTIAQMENQGYGTAGQLFNQDQARALQAQQANQGMGLQAFGANAGQFNTDQARMLQAAQQEAAQGQQAQNMGMTNANSVMNVGNVQQNLGQQSLSQQYQNFLNQQQWPEQQYGFLQSAFRQQPFLNNMGGTTTGNTSAQMPQPSGFQNALGLGFLGLGAASIFSSRDYKEGGVVANPDDALDAIEQLPLEMWRYKGSPDPHLGTYAEEFQHVTGLGDGKTIPLVDAIGLAFGGLQAVARHLHRLEQRVT